MVYNMETNGEKLFNEFIKHHIPKFAEYFNTGVSMFCAYTHCDKCLINNTCGAKVIPLVGKETARKYLEKHPEYRI